VWADRGPFKVGCDVLEVSDVGSRLDIVRLPAMHHQESDEPENPAFDAWTGWVLQLVMER
jgi:hypothetical protein